MNTPAEPGRALLSCEGPVAVITLSNSSRMNAIDGTMAESLCGAVAELAGRADLRVVLLRGAGDQAFCAGMDVKYATATGDRNAAIAAMDRRLQHFLQALQALQRPVVALLQGVCYGAGVHLALAADFRLADAQVRLSVPALRNKLVYPVDALTRLRTLVGRQRAARILLEGAVYRAADLAAWGLVDAVLGPGEVESGVRAFCESLADKDPALMREYLEIFSRLDAGDLAGAHAAREAARARLALEAAS